MSWFFVNTWLEVFVDDWQWNCLCNCIEEVKMIWSRLFKRLIEERRSFLYGLLSWILIHQNFKLRTEVAVMLFAVVHRYPWPSCSVAQVVCHMGWSCKDEEVEEIPDGEERARFQLDADIEHDELFCYQWWGARTYWQDVCRPWKCLEVLGMSIDTKFALHDIEDEQK